MLGLLIYVRIDLVITSTVCNELKRWHLPSFSIYKVMINSL